MYEKVIRHPRDLQRKILNRHCKNRLKLIFMLFLPQKGESGRFKIPLPSSLKKYAKMLSSQIYFKKCPFI